MINIDVAAAELGGKVEEGMIVWHKGLKLRDVESGMNVSRCGECECIGERFGVSSCDDKTGRHSGA